MCSLECDQQPGPEPRGQGAREADPGEHPPPRPQAPHQGRLRTVHPGHQCSLLKGLSSEMGPAEIIFIKETGAKNFRKICLFPIL